jgi:mRNA interferase RelE/StbE
MSADRAYAITWTETALKLAEAIPDQRTRRLISQRAEQLAKSPEQQGKPPSVASPDLRSVRASGQRLIVYRVERREVVVLIVAVGRRRGGDRSDIYELAKKLLRQGLSADATRRRSGLGEHRSAGRGGSAARSREAQLPLGRHCRPSKALPHWSRFPAPAGSGAVSTGRRADQTPGLTAGSSTLYEDKHWSTDHCPP